MTTVSIPLHSRKYPGLVALVDEQDYLLVRDYRWYPRPAGYLWYAVTDTSRKTGKKRLMMHRVIMNASRAIEIDHEDRNGLNNTRGNLRVATHSNNQHNRTVQHNNTSGFKGVYWHGQIGRWRARVGFNGIAVSAGCFATSEEAARAYDAKARELHGEFARLNFPD